MINILCEIFSIFYIILEKIFGFYSTSILISRIPLQVGNLMRYKFYSKILVRVGDNVLFSYGIILSRKDISIGSNVRFGPHTTIGLADFGDNILVAQSVHFLSGSKQHGIILNNIPIINQKGKSTRIKIGSDIWIGTQAVIMADIADGNVIGAGSVVPKNINEKNSIFVGNPARKVRDRKF